MARLSARAEPPRAKYTAAALWGGGWRSSPFGPLQSRILFGLAEHLGGGRQIAGTDRGEGLVGEGLGAIPVGEVDARQEGRGGLAEVVVVLELDVEAGAAQVGVNHVGGLGRREGELAEAVARVQRQVERLAGEGAVVGGGPTERGGAVALGLLGGDDPVEQRSRLLGLAGPEEQLAAVEHLLGRTARVVVGGGNLGLDGGRRRPRPGRGGARAGHDGALGARGPTADTAEEPDNRGGQEEARQGLHAWILTRPRAWLFPLPNQTRSCGCSAVRTTHAGAP